LRNFNGVFLIAGDLNPPLIEFKKIALFLKNINGGGINSPAK